MLSRYASQGLNREQRGHLRHFANLLAQPDNDWSLMKGRGFGQEDFGAFRFQLAYMAYALGLTHIHRLPSAPGLFKPLYERVMRKILLPDVWMYWHDVSRGGTIFNRHLSYGEEWNPVGRDNIMYSAYVQSMALLYHYLFGDERFAHEGALTFKFWSYFWGGEPKVFSYDESSLNEHVYWLMVQSGYLGVACEPNCVFQICNQPAILGFRLHDLLKGGSRATEVIEGYEAAWRDFGRIGENGHYHIMISADTRTVRPNRGRSPWVDAWLGALMNMWNRDFVREHYPQQLRDLIAPGPDGTMTVVTQPRPDVMGEKVVGDDCDFGWVTVWCSEMGDTATLEGLLRHADRHMRPTWRDGGLYYPRNDLLADEFGNRTLMEPHTGNVLLAYARLNVPDGLWGLYNEPLSEEFRTAPALTRVDRGVEVHRAFIDSGTLRFTIAQSTANDPDQWVAIGRLPQQKWILRCDQAEIARGSAMRLDAATERATHIENESLAIRCPAAGVHEFSLDLA